MMNFLIHIDEQAFLFLNSFHCPLCDGIMIFVTSKISWIPLYIFILWKIFHKDRWGIVYFIVCAVFCVLLSDRISVFVKEYFQRLRPCHNDSLKMVVYTVNGRCGGLYGFVSSHAANAFAVATLVSLVCKRKTITIIMTVYAILVSYSRIYLGVHFPADIIGGALLGICIAVPVYYLYVVLLKRYLSSAWQ